MTELRRQAAAGGIQQGDTIRITRTFTEQDIQEFGRITRDFNPVHYDERWWKLKGFSGPIMHGLLVGGMLCEPGGQWGWLADGMSFEFLKPVYVGDTVTCEMTIVDLDERRRARAECVLTNQHQEKVMTAELSGYLPGEPEQELLDTMLKEGECRNES